MGWYPGEPAGDKAIKELVFHMPENWVYIEDSFGKEHKFPEPASAWGVSWGKHRSGLCRVLFAGPPASINALADPASGAMAYDTTEDATRLIYFDGSVWQFFDDLVHPIGGWFSGDLEVLPASAGSGMLDGRDPSVDGARLDTMSTYSRTFGVNFDDYMTNGQTLDKPNTPTDITWENSDCVFFACARQQFVGGHAAYGWINNSGVISCSVTAHAICIAIGDK